MKEDTHNDRLKKRINRLRYLNPHWSETKLRYIAAYDLPKKKKSEWE